MRTRFALSWLSVVLGFVACRSSEAPHAGGNELATRGPGVVASWTGSDSASASPRFTSAACAAELDALWAGVVERPESSPARAGAPPDVSDCIGFAWSAGTTWNTKGYDVKAIERIGAEWHVRLAPITYQSMGEGDRVRPYAVVLLTRVPGATIVVDEDVRDLIDAPPQWKERGRFAVPALASGGARSNDAARRDGGPASADSRVASAIPAAVASPETARFAPDVLAAVRAYERYPRVSDHPGWSPLDCRAPPSAGPLVSASDDAATHGSKLYHVFAKDAAAYDARAVDGLKEPERGHEPSAPCAPAPVGQVLVKEAWHPELVELPAPNADGARALPESARSLRGFGLAEDCASRDGRLYRKGAQAELFVLMKLDPSTPGTDAGWIYATVTPDRKRVTAAGRIESCMRCHEKAEHDRQFGLPSDWVGMRQPSR